MFTMILRCSWSIDWILAAAVISWAISKHSTVQSVSAMSVLCQCVHSAALLYTQSLTLTDIQVHNNIDFLSLWFLSSNEKLNLYYSLPVYFIMHKQMYVDVNSVLWLQKNILWLECPPSNSCSMMFRWVVRGRSVSVMIRRGGRSRGMTHVEAGIAAVPGGLLRPTVSVPAITILNVCAFYRA